MNNHCKIGKVTLKGGATLKVFPNDMRNYVVYKLGWGEVTFRTYDEQTITRETVIFMLRALEDDVLRGE